MVIQIVNLNDLLVLSSDLYNVLKNRMYNRTLVAYYERLKIDVNFDNFLNIDNKVNAIDDCNKFIQTITYQKNLVKSLERTNLCRDKFCRNCKKVKQINRSDKFTPELEKYKSKLYHMVLTVPNVESDYLNETIKRMFKAYRQLMRYFSMRAKATDVDFKYGYLGSIRSLEITFKNYTTDGNNYHPHLHCAVVFNDNPVLKKNNYNVYSYSYKSIKQRNPETNKLEDTFKNEITPFSDFEILVQKVWYLLYEGKKVNKFNIDNLREGYSCKIDKFQDGDYAELFKYMIKEMDEDNKVLSYDVFKTLLVSLHNVRQIQGYGCFYGLKNVDNDDIFKMSDEAWSKFINDYTNGEKGKITYDRTKDLFFDHKYKLVTKKKMYKKFLEINNDEKEKERKDE